MAARRPSLRRPSPRATVLLVAGVAGVVLAHGLDYVLVLRSPAERAARLAATGHGWWPTAATAAVGAACLAASMSTARGAAGTVFRHAAHAGTGGSAWHDVRRTALWQVSLFGAVEALERIGAHRSPAELAHGPLFPVGLLLQVVVAAVVVAGLRVFERAGEAVAEVVVAGQRRRPREARRPMLDPVALAAGAGTVVPGGLEARGPPRVAVSLL